MLKKLYQHEFHALLRNLWPAYLALLVLAFINRLTSMVGQEGNPIWDGVQNFFMGTYVLSIGAVVVLSVILVVMRFYQHLVTDQGYLTFSLPVKAGSHLTCKLVSGVTAIVLSVVGVLLSIFLRTVGTKEWDEFIVAVQYLSKNGKQITGGTDLAVVLWVLAGMLLLAIVSGLLLFYFSISLGQQFKNRVGAAVLCFFGLYMVFQIFGMFVLVPTVLDMAPAMEAAARNAEAGTIFSMVSRLLLSCSVLWVVLDVGMYFGSRFLLTKRLNLE